jgi:hypothetical protein
MSSVTLQGDFDLLQTLKAVEKGAVKAITYPISAIESAVLTPASTAISSVGQTASSVVKSTTGPLIAIAVVALVAGGGYLVFRKQIAAAIAKRR